MDGEISFVVRITLPGSGHKCKFIFRHGIPQTSPIAFWGLAFVLSERPKIFLLPLRAQIKTPHWANALPDFISQMPPQPVGGPDMLRPVPAAFSQSRPPGLRTPGKGNESRSPNTGLLWKQRWPTPPLLQAIFEKEARWQTRIGIFQSRDYSLGLRCFQRWSVNCFLALRVTQQVALFCAQKMREALIPLVHVLSSPSAKKTLLS